MLDVAATTKKSVPISFAFAFTWRMTRSVRQLPARRLYSFWVFSFGVGCSTPATGILLVFLVAK